MTAEEHDLFMNDVRRSQPDQARHLGWLGFLGLLGFSGFQNPLGFMFFGFLLFFRFFWPPPRAREG